MCPIDTLRQKVMGVRVAGAMQPSAKKKGATAALRRLLDDARGTCLIELFGLASAELRYFPLY